MITGLVQAVHEVQVNIEFIYKGNPCPPVCVLPIPCKVVKLHGLPGLAGNTLFYLEITAMHARTLPGPIRDCLDLVPEAGVYLGIWICKERPN